MPQGHNLSAITIPYQYNLSMKRIHTPGAVAKVDWRAGRVLTYVISQTRRRLLKDKRGIGGVGRTRQREEGELRLVEQEGAILFMEVGRLNPTGFILLLSNKTSFRIPTINSTKV
jgi:hypothetical protein